jgi:hypothetical protein
MNITIPPSRVIVVVIVIGITASPVRIGMGILVRLRVPRIGCGNRRLFVLLFFFVFGGGSGGRLLG